MVRKATIEDGPEVCFMAEKFANESPYRDMYTLQKLLNVIDQCLMDEDKVVLISEHGIIAGVAAEFIYGDSKVATELCWWVDPKFRGSREGKDLLDAFEGWAKDVGCTYVTMVSIDDSVGSYYEKRGYSLTERAFMKAL